MPREANSAWMQAHLAPDQRAQLEQLVLTIFATDRHGFVHLVGSSCVLLTQGRQALAVTAKHNFDEVRRRQQPETQSHASMPDIFRPEPRPLDLSPKLVRAMYFDGTNVDACEITSVNAIPEFDIAFFTVRFQEQYTGPDFRLRAELDCRPLRVGEHVATIALDGLEVLEQDVSDGSSRSAKISKSLDVRRGSVTHAYFAGGRSPWPAAETTMPIKGGMSGSAVFRVKEDGALEKGVCAIVSKDLSDPAAFSSFIVEGHSTVAMIFPAMLTPVSAIPPGWSGDALPLVLDLVKGGVIGDLGDFESLFRVSNDGSHTRIEIR